METVLAALGANALVLGALTYLVRSLISHRLEKDMQTFKDDLRRDAERQVEEYKSTLEKERIRLQISYGGIFEQQAKAILDIHRAVVELEQAASDCMHTGGAVPERRNLFRGPWHALRTLHNQSRVLLPEETDEAVADFIDRMFRGVFDYLRVEARDLSRVSDQEFEKLSDKQERAIEVIEREVPQLREKLVKSMRSVLGVVANEF